MADEKDLARQGGKRADIYAEWLAESAEFRKDYRRRITVLKGKDMPFEDSPDGFLKHMVHEKLGTTECCLDVYMQFLPPGGRSGRSRRLAEQVLYVAEGRGYDLQWDVKYEVDVEFHWSWETEPKRYDWQKGDFVFVPAYSIVQHFNADPKAEARLIVMTNRIMKAMGLDWIEQLENAPDYKGDLPTELAGPGWNPDTRDRD
jgi:hypothetical protein